jgi:hypothetical protein
LVEFKKLPCFASSNWQTTIKLNIMKTQIILLTIFLALFFNHAQAQVAINNDNTTANSSAMLDVKSTAKGILIPRMTTAQRTAISSPANGLLVYDESTHSFWFYDSNNSGWTELVTQSGASNINDLSDASTDNESVFVGEDAGAHDDGNNYNTSLGKESLHENTSGAFNTAVGNGSGQNTTTGNHNSYYGSNAGYFNQTGSDNTAVGYGAGIGSSGSSYSGCVLLGAHAGENNTSDNKLFIDNSSTATPLIGGDFSTDQVDINGTIKITGGSPGAGKILTSDANGLASWASLNGAIELDDLSDASADNQSVYVGEDAGANDDGNNYNTSLGKESLHENTSGAFNTAVGNGSGQNTTTGNHNSYYGSNAGYFNQTGSDNTAVGYGAGIGSSGSSYSGCVLLGAFAGENNTSDNKLFIDNSSTATPLIGGDFFTNQVDINGTIKITGGSPGAGKVLTSDANGLASWDNPSWANELDDLSDATTDNESVFIGEDAGANDDGTNYNAALGVRALEYNTSGIENVALGYAAGLNNTTGSDNVYIGPAAGLYNAAGDDNVLVGMWAGKSSLGNSFSGCVMLGNNAGMNNTSDNKLFIDNSSTSSPLIGGDFFTNQVDINGTIKITGGSPGAGKVLTSDANGLASWTSLTTGATDLDGLSDATTDSKSVFIGSGAGANDDGNNYNTAIGISGLYHTTSGTRNSVIGFSSGNANTTGTDNTFLGYGAAYYTQTGSENTIVGSGAGRGSSGNSYSGCVMLGYQAGNQNSSDNKLYIDNSNTSTPLIGGDFSTDQVDINGTLKISGGNPGVGKVLTSDINGLASWTSINPGATELDELNDVTRDGTRFFMGYNAGINNSGAYNTGIGYDALKLNTTGTHNTALGYKVLDANIGGKYNTAIGHAALGANSSGDANTALGYGTLGGITSGHYNTAIGYNAFSSGNYSNSTAIGYGTTITGSNQVHIGNTSITEIKGQVSFTQYSDGRVKNHIREDVPGLEFINQLRPVTYHFDVKKENEILGIHDSLITNHSELDSIRFTGFIAQEVEKAAEKCSYDFSGVKKPSSENELYGLSYSEFVVPLVKAVQEQQALIETQQKQLEEMQQRLQELEKAKNQASNHNSNPK